VRQQSQVQTHLRPALDEEPRCHDKEPYPAE
jgi:hypothetical protein